MKNLHLQKTEIRINLITIVNPHKIMVITEEQSDCCSFSTGKDYFFAGSKVEQTVHLSKDKYFQIEVDKSN